MIDSNSNQRELSWYRDRMGFLTGSRISDIMKTGKKKDDPWSETAKSYLYQIAGERLFSNLFLYDDDIFQDYISQTSFTTKAMQWGVDMEDDAKRCFSKMAGNEWAVIEEVSSCHHDSLPYFSASPDGIVYGHEGQGDRIIEVKCPGINTYMKYRTLIHDAASLKETEPKYYWQMMAEMSCTKAVSGVFIAYCPWLTKPIHWAVIERDEDDIRLMEERVALANRFIEEIINK